MDDLLERLKKMEDCYKKVIKREDCPEEEKKDLRKK
jgi:hypothetical protein